jgi:hypothetical protein
MLSLERRSIDAGFPSDLSSSLLSDSYDTIYEVTWGQEILIRLR